MCINFKSCFSALLAMSLAVVATSCSDDNTPDDGELSAKESTLKAAVEPYVDVTVIPTYTAMADAAIEMYDLCEVIHNKFDEGTLTDADVEAAGAAWKEARRHWELSEAFLFGPANDHNIDPHIDSWPLDKTAMDALLADIRAGKSWSVENHGGYGLLGFHAVEYLLFELTADGQTALPHSTTSYTTEELDYMLAVAEDLRNQCILLEQCWAGVDNISSEKQEILEDAELGYNEQYGWEMKNAGQGGSRFRTYQSAAEEILQGCIDIVDEVGNTKIGRPHMGSSLDDRNYIESPYALNSIEDFQDNIRSVQNAYCGTSGKASVSDYVKKQNASVDSKVRAAITAAISAIGLIPEPFASTASGSEAAAAIEACQDLQDALDEAMNVVSAQQ